MQTKKSTLNEVDQTLVFSDGLISFHFEISMAELDPKNTRGSLYAAVAVYFAREFPNYDLPPQRVCRFLVEADALKMHIIYQQTADWVAPWKGKKKYSLRPPVEQVYDYAAFFHRKKGDVVEVYGRPGLTPDQAMKIASEQYFSPAGIDGWMDWKRQIREHFILYTITVTN